MRITGLAVVGCVLALAPAPAAWAQEDGPVPMGDPDAAFSTAAVAGSSGPGIAAITAPCPALIVRNTTLRQDCVGPIEFGADEVQLNMAGHTVTCNDDPGAIGIVARNRFRNRIVNGTVTDCGTGILLLRGGEHNVRNVTLTSHDKSAPAARPATGTFNFGTGLEIHASDDNDVMALDAAENLLGVWVVQLADRNRLQSLRITEGRPVFSGVEIQRSSHNTIVGSLFDTAGFAGVLVDGGEGNVVRSSQAARAAFGLAAGARFQTTGTLFQASVAEENGIDGIRLFNDADETTVKSNRATLNRQVGIRVAAGSTSNELTNNVARLNTPFDLADHNVACDANVWLHNQFDTANQPCIQ